MQARAQSAQLRRVDAPLARRRRQPFGDRVVFIGDSGTTKLYKDGIGAAYRTSKAAANTVAYWGVGLPVGYTLGLTDWWGPAMGPEGFWIGLLSGLTAAALMLTVRLRFRLRLFAAAAATR